MDYNPIKPTLFTKNSYFQQLKINKHTGKFNFLD